MKLTESDILTFLSIEVGVDTKNIRPDTPLFSSGIIDSFSLVSLITLIETSCSIRVSPMDVNLDNMDSIVRILGYVGRSGPG